MPVPATGDNGRGEGVMVTSNGDHPGCCPRKSGTCRCER
ncbi:unnamed protein product [Tenebrio molitor]|nr:unnamed protein product [Tenebrio molitor]